MRAAAVQLTATEDTARNLATADRLVRDAAAQGARLVVLPEKWTVLGSEAAMDANAESPGADLGARGGPRARHRPGGGLDRRASPRP
jgi:predicted amidohydrolase